MKLLSILGVNGLQQCLASNKMEGFKKDKRRFVLNPISLEW